MEAAFRGRKSYPSQNVLVAVDFDLRFTYVLAGWEGTAHDALVLRDALERPNGLRVPQGNIALALAINSIYFIYQCHPFLPHIIGKFYLVDGGYGAKKGFLPPFRGVRYHLNEWGNNPVQNEKELFNLRHSSLRVGVERGIGSLKRRFKVLDDATPFFPYATQVDIVVACCTIHNWVIEDGIDELIISETEWAANPIPSTTSSGQAADLAYMVNFRQELADAMWADRQNHYDTNM
jgi:hypothetical protein